MTEEEKLEEEEEEALEELIEKLESGIKKNDKDDFKNAFIEIKKKANGGYAKAQFALGEFYFYKNGGYDYDNKAVRWYQLAAKHGHALDR